ITGICGTAEDAMRGDMDHAVCARFRRTSKALDGKWLVEHARAAGNPADCLDFPPDTGQGEGFAQSLDAIRRIALRGRERICRAQSQRTQCPFLRETTGFVALRNCGIE